MQKTAYEIRISDVILTCALPICRARPDFPGVARRPGNSNRRDAGQSGPGAENPAFHGAGPAGRGAVLAISGPCRPRRFGYVPAHGSNRDIGNQKPAAVYGRAGGTGHASGCDFRRSEEHTSELKSLMRISYAVFCLK